MQQVLIPIMNMDLRTTHNKEISQLCISGFPCSKSTCLLAFPHTADRSGVYKSNFFHSSIMLPFSKSHQTMGYLLNIVFILHRCHRSMIILNILQLKLGHHFGDHIFKLIFLNKDSCILIQMPLIFILKGSISNKPALVQIMARHQAIIWTNDGPSLLEYKCHSASMS